jgi:hypothetical protein
MFGCLLIQSATALSQTALSRVSVKQLGIGSGKFPGPSHTMMLLEQLAK